MARSIQEYVDELYGKGQGTLNQIHEQRKQSDQQLIDSVNAAIDRTTTASTKPYQTQIEQLPEAYQKQFDANAVQELVGRRKVEEAMANMGLTDSGLNRTQQTALSVQRSNADAAARLEQQKKTQELQDKIAQLIEAGAAQKQQQAAGVLSNTSNWFNNALASSYSTAMQQGTSMYNADLARDEQARQAELDRQNALAKAKYEAQTAQAQATAKAKQQEFENKIALAKLFAGNDATPEEIARYAQTLGLLPSSNSGAGSSGSASSGIKYEPKSRGVYLGGKVERGEISKWDAVKDIIDNFQGDELAMRRAAQSAGVLDLLMQRYK